MTTAHHRPCNDQSERVEEPGNQNSKAPGRALATAVDECQDPMHDDGQIHTYVSEDSGQLDRYCDSCRWINAGSETHRLPQVHHLRTQTWLFMQRSAGFSQVIQ